MGSLLDARHVLTARHCWAPPISQKYSWPVVFYCEGLFRCEVVFESAADDVIVLRMVEQLEDCQLARATKFPRIAKKPVFMGAWLGFISTMKIYADAHTPERHNHLAVGIVSMMFPANSENSFRLALSSTAIQPGFSGSAVFLPDGAIVGVVLEMMKFRADLKDPRTPLQTLPVISPICELANDIKAILAK
jgi:hypothetical protein